MSLKVEKLKGEKGRPMEVHASQSYLWAWQDHGADDLEAVLTHMETKDVTGDNQHGFTKGKLCLTN